MLERLSLAFGREGGVWGFALDEKKGCEQSVRTGRDKDVGLPFFPDDMISFPPPIDEFPASELENELMESVLRKFFIFLGQDLVPVRGK